MKTLLPASALLAATSLAAAQSAPTAAQIVDRMEQKNQLRANDLRHYTSLRHYLVAYTGFPKDVTAAIDVQLDYDAPATKKFRILAESGSKYVCEHVLRKLVEGETEAGREQRSYALTRENYNFSLAGYDNLNGRPAYILNVEPLTASKYLYRGKIWVDATDYAVMRIDAEPAKNPSFWISQAQIHHTYSKVGEFWLPASNHSESKVRIGGTAVLTIDYGLYTHLNEASLQTASR